MQQRFLVIAVVQSLLNLLLLDLIKVQLLLVVIRESLPAFASLILVAAVSGHGDVTDTLAPWALAARIGQSTAHLVSTSSLGVQVRFAFFLPQIVIQVIWAIALLRIALVA